MKLSSKIFPRVASLFMVTTLSILSTSSALAEYRLTAFGHTMGFAGLVQADLERIESTFKDRNIDKLDHFEANNLCVAQILLKDLDQAIASCTAAADKADGAFALGPDVLNSAKATIYSNMAVAKAMNGDKISAIKDLEIAKSFNAKDRNVSSNYNQLAPTENLTASIR